MYKIYTIFVDGSFEQRNNMSKEMRIEILPTFGHVLVQFIIVWHR